MIERSLERFDLYPSRLLGDSGYGSAEMLGWLVYEHGIEPHVTVFDKSARTDGIFSRQDFTYDHAADVYHCPGGKVLTTTGSLVNDNATMLYLASKRDCDRCALKSLCCPKAGFTEGSALDLRGRSRHGAPDSEIVGGRYLTPAPQENRDAVRAPQAHSQARPFTFTRPKRRARRVHPRSHRPESSKDGEADPDARIDPATRCSRCHYNAPRCRNPAHTATELFSSCHARLGSGHQYCCTILAKIEGQPRPNAAN
jgi:hypothetical protein